MERGFLKRFFRRQANSGGVGAIPAAGQAEPAPNLVRYVDSDPRSRPAVRVLISALGPSVPNREDQIRTVAAATLAGGQQPVVVATHLSTTFLVAEQFPVEILPLRSDLKALSDAEYDAYLRRRWTLILAKWAIAEEIDLGAELDAFLADQTAAPQA